MRGGWDFDGVDVTSRKTLCRLAWAVGRTQAGKAELLSLLQTNEGNSADFVDVRRAALLAIGECKLAKGDLPVIGGSPDSRSPTPRLRQTAAEILAQQNAAGSDPARCANCFRIARRFDACWRMRMLMLHRPSSEKRGPRSLSRRSFLPQLVASR